jgi:hypothetical protein
VLRVYTDLRRLPAERHSSLRRSTIRFTVIARKAAREEIVPRRTAASRARDHVIERERLRSEDPVTVLATVPVAQHDALARCRSILTRHTAIDQTAAPRRESLSPSWRSSAHVVDAISTNAAPFNTRVTARPAATTLYYRRLSHDAIDGRYLSTFQYRQLPTRLAVLDAFGSLFTSRFR